MVILEFTFFFLVEFFVVVVFSVYTIVSELFTFALAVSFFFIIILQLYHCYKTFSYVVPIEFHFEVDEHRKG